MSRYRIHRFGAQRIPHREESGGPEDAKIVSQTPYASQDSICSLREISPAVGKTGPYKCDNKYVDVFCSNSKATFTAESQRVLSILFFSLSADLPSLKLWHGKEAEKQKATCLSAGTHEHQLSIDLAIQINTLHFHPFLSFVGDSILCSPALRGKHKEE